MYLGYFISKIKTNEVEHTKQIMTVNITVYTISISKIKTNKIKKNTKQIITVSITDHTRQNEWLLNNLQIKLLRKEIWAISPVPHEFEITSYLDIYQSKMPSCSKKKIAATSLKGLIHLDHVIPGQR